MLLPAAHETHHPIHAVRCLARSCSTIAMLRWIVRRVKYVCLAGPRGGMVPPRQGSAEDARPEETPCRSSRTRTRPRWRSGRTSRSIASGREVLKADARRFHGPFPGKTAYAVKTNGEKIVLQSAGRGRRQRLRRRLARRVRGRARRLADAEMLYMHPVKAQSDIRLALETIRHPRDRRSTMRTKSPRSCGSCAALDIDPSDDHALRAPADARARRPTSCRRSSAPGRPMRWSWLQRIDRHRLQGRTVLPCRQPDRGSRHL